ncbi:hypothetical protein PVPAM_060007300 [Plasmodium vivax]|nr:hypothetical protein PVPAM_060007300 [Plasmodium vivax]
MTAEDYTEDTYQIFKNFLDIHNLSLVSDSDRCKRELVKIEYDKYMEMKPLYEVYVTYTTLSQPYAHTKERYCSNMEYLVRLYNTFLNRYESGSLKFNKVLKYFQGLMDKIVLAATPHSSKSNFVVVNSDLFELEIIPPPPSEREREEVEENSHNEEGSEVSYPLTSTATLDSNKVGGIEHPYNTLEPSEQVNPFGKIGSYVSPRSHRPGRSYGEETSYEPREYLDTNSTLSLGEKNFESTHLKESLLRNEDVRLLGKIKSTFSGIVSEVEPAPILGVFGGMGALFLLFKYSPVGIFFVGRKGRNHRILTGFPGAYTGFPEYYDGNF